MLLSRTLAQAPRLPHADVADRRARSGRTDDRRAGSGRDDEIDVAQRPRPLRGVPDPAADETHRSAPARTQHFPTHRV